VFYFHVPVAWLTVLGFLISAIYSVLYLRKKELRYDVKADASARLGFLFSILATISGSAWAKITWGEFWNWDPRETSILVLLIIYMAYFTLRASIPEPEKRGNLSAVYSLVAFATVPILIFVIPRIYDSLHPDPILNERGKVEMSSSIRMIFLFSMTGFTILFFYLKKLNDDVMLLLQNKRNRILSALQREVN
jgi:heme exporter protein C